MTRDFIHQFEIPRLGGTVKVRPVTLPPGATAELPMWTRWLLIPSEGLPPGMVVRSKRGVLGAPAIVQQHVHTDYVTINNSGTQSATIELYIVTPS